MLLIRKFAAALREAVTPPVPVTAPATFDGIFPDFGELPRSIADKIVHTVKPYSMVSYPGLYFTIAKTVEVMRSVDGVLVECGTWKGGCALAMLMTQRALYGAVPRKVYLLDSFQGLPTATQKDGPLANQWQNTQSRDVVYENCRCPQDDVVQNLARFGFGEADYEIVPGWFSETARPLAQRLSEEGIALLRLDGDWYESTMDCLQSLEPIVRENGIVILDDYYAWDGCARALHEYISRQDFSYRIRSIITLDGRGFDGAYFVKKKARDTFSHL